ncbi:CoaA Panthothenate kinase [Pyrenophora tritici-repentis]|uniref:Panthothenate kinase n=1 Tax=Pyrenophora tritici-repentis TaxID=45151 RepID=A0A2W1HKL5_9PLEO|nr:Nicotinamide riboside kinase [Pyrenophora tritici-repentis]KAF7449084.1 Nicotinamide riboside kinase [Pyrenophora tritici-repentis]KAF7570914.1 CoaA, Panthothenate kinase [Pyrenophora tritici-repentis]KAG9383977.1 Nicotinamide riboside kinase [Pyrenophora tritici-repentis]KAI0574394.1 Nicotinamide riboside kinase [Pyrenophora tritici-repentis]
MANDSEVDTIPTAILDLVRRTERLLVRQASNPSQRMLVALAGVPGSGKSTVSEALLAELAKQGVQDVAAVPMDGFHYTREVLSTFENSELAFKRRGAPFTFDAEGCVKLVKLLKSTPVTVRGEDDLCIAAPSFDHALKDPVQEGVRISSRIRLVIIEGNYTLLRQSPWDQIAEICDERWFVDAPPEKVRVRLAQRHLAAGIETSMPAAIARAEENDIPNGELIRSMLMKPDVIIQN